MTGTQTVRKYIRPLRDSTRGGDNDGRIFIIIFIQIVNLDLYQVNFIEKN